ncbi:MAG: hypothetical protein KAS72_14165 [Phycisphaerales bacterium]|nr:hypothetical protein [Phycisphaerales bacterium]
MTRLDLIGSLALVLLITPMTRAQNPGSQDAAGTDKPINALCPISKEPVAPSTETVEYNGHTIGFCCAGCVKGFLAWDEARKVQFVAAALAESHGPNHADHHSDITHDAKPWTEPYALDICPVSGGKLGSMGDPIVKTYDGREVRFCCGGCIKDFEADQAGYFKKIDERIVEDQLRYYPTDTCIVSGDPLVEDGEDIAINMVYGNRLVRFCCEMCTREFKADPEKFIKRLDKKVADAQRKAYPLDTCAVSGKELGSMGEPLEMVLAGRLFRLCCAVCEPDVKADPVKYVTEIDKSWQSVGKFMPIDDHAHADGG